MKKKLLLLTFTIILSTQALASEVADILIYNRTQTKWNVFLLKEFRTFMNNLSMGIDPYTYTHSKNLIFSEENIEEFIAEDAAILLEKVSVASGINILDVKPELSIMGLGYTIDSIKPQISPEEKSNGDVLLKSNVSIQGIESFADEIKLSFILNQRIAGKQVPALEVKIVKPKVIVNKSKAIAFGVDVLLREGKESIQLGFENGDFSKITEQLKSDPELIDIQYDDIKIPEITLRFMGRNLSINEAHIKKIIEEHKPSLKVILLEQVRTLFEKDGAMELLKKFDGTSFAKNYWIPSTSDAMFPLFLGMKDFSVPMKGILLTELTGDFCTTDGYARFEGDCVNNRITPVSKSTISDADTAYSKTNIETQLKKNKDIKFIASLSEDYINKAIVTTVDFGIWEPILKDIGIEMGDKKVLIKIDKTGQHATVLLDVLYDVGKLPGLLLSERILRFPVILDATIKVVYIDVESTNDKGEVVTESMPHIVFNIADVNLDDSVLLYGQKKYEFPSTIQKVRKFLGIRNMVIKQIKKELFDYDAPSEPEKFAKWKGVDLPPIILPEIKDMYLEKMDISADGHGRLNLILKGSETLYRQ